MRFMFLVSALTAIAFLFTALCCAADCRADCNTGNAKNAGALNRVATSPSGDQTLSVGEVRHFAAKALDANGLTIYGANFTWEFSGDVGKLSSAYGPDTNFSALTKGGGTVTVICYYQGITKTGTVSVSVRSGAELPPCVFIVIFFIGLAVLYASIQVYQYTKRKKVVRRHKCNYCGRLTIAVSKCHYMPIEENLGSIKCTECEHETIPVCSICKKPMDLKTAPGLEH